MLNKKNYIVTGGSGLIGSSVVEKLVELGANVYNIDLVSKNSKEFFIECDLTQSESLLKAFELIISKADNIHGLINCAYPKIDNWHLDFDKIPIESWNKSIESHLGSLFASCQIVLSHMSRKCFGSIVNVGSIYGIVGPSFEFYEDLNMTMPAAYSAIKGAVPSFTRFLAALYGKSGIRVNCISPGGVFNNQDPLFVKRYSDRVPIGRMGSPHEIADVIIFLLDDTSSYITGQNIVVDGGYSII